MNVPSVPKDWRESMSDVDAFHLAQRIGEGYKAILDLAAIVTEQRDLLSNLLARIHRDGGHHEGKVGTGQACKDADERVVALMATSEGSATLAELRAKLDRYARAFDAACTAWHFLPSDDPKADLDRLAAMERQVAIDLTPLADVIEARLGKREWEYAGGDVWRICHPEDGRWWLDVELEQPQHPYVVCGSYRGHDFKCPDTATTAEDAKRLAIRALAEIIAKEVEG